MGNYESMRLILTQLTGQSNIITTPKIFIEYTGDITTAVLLNQIIFYSDKSKRTDGFFYKTYREWNEELCLTERQVRYSAKKLKDMGIIETELHRANGSPTVHYKFLFEKFAESILTFCQGGYLQNVSMDHDKMSGTITENTTENTTEKKEKAASLVSKKKRQVKTGDLSSLYPDEKTHQKQKQVAAKYEELFGVANMTMLRLLQQKIDLFEVEVVIDALNRMKANAKKPSSNYLDAIFKKWEAAGVKNLADVEALESKHLKQTKAPTEAGINKIAAMMEKLKEEGRV